MNPGEDPRRASLNAALAAADDAISAMPLDDPRRGPLSRRIRDIEDALDGLGDVA